VCGTRGADYVPPHVWVMRVDPPGIPWPPRASVAGAAAADLEAIATAVAAENRIEAAGGAAGAYHNPITRDDPAGTAAIAAAKTPSALEADVVAAGVALLTAAGAAPPILPTVAAKGTAADVRAGGLGCAFAASGDPGNATYMRLMGGPLEAFFVGDAAQEIPPAPDLLAPAQGVNGAVRRLLGGRPALVFAFGEEAMNPVGGVVAVAWSPALLVGLLVEFVST